MLTTSVSSALNRHRCVRQCFAAAVAALTVTHASALPDEEDRLLSHRASEAARNALHTRDVGSLLELVLVMKVLACARGEELVCNHFQAFERGTLPDINASKTLWFGPAAIGTQLARYSFGACVFNPVPSPALAECFRFGPADEADFTALTQALAQQKSGPVDPSSRLFKFLQARARLPSTLPIAKEGELLAAYRHKDPDAPLADEKPLPTLLRQQGDVMYAASVTMQPVRPASFDSYPTLMLAVLRPVR